jgi:glutamyl-Q tRNA(Asp) synthetase
LHLGHAYSAILAHDMARAAGGAFLLRMEDTDLDPLPTGVGNCIVEDLTWLGLSWDEPVHRQSDQIARYNARLEPLADRDLLYPCSCTRSDIRAALSAPQEGVAHSVYPGTLPVTARMGSRQCPGDALRFDLASSLSSQSSRRRDVGLHRNRSRPFGNAPCRSRGRHARIGDVVLSRKGEDIVAYFLASAFDDADQGISHVIRGEDLFAFTPDPGHLQRLFGLPTPLYHHHRLIRDGAGKRLAKRDDARAIRKYRDEGATPADIRRMVGL